MLPRPYKLPNLSRSSSPTRPRGMTMGLNASPRYSVLAIGSPSPPQAPSPPDSPTSAFQPLLHEKLRNEYQRSHANSNPTSSSHSRSHSHPQSYSYSYSQTWTQTQTRSHTRTRTHTSSQPSSNSRATHRQRSQSQSQSQSHTHSYSLSGSPSTYDLSSIYNRFPGVPPASVSPRGVRRAGGGMMRVSAEWQSPPPYQLRESWIVVKPPV